MAEFNLSASPESSILRNLVSLKNGGLAAVMQDLNPFTRAVIATRLVLFGPPEPDGSMQKISEDIVFNTTSTSLTLLPLNDGGVAFYQRGFIPEVGTVVVARIFDAAGQSTGETFLQGTLALSLTLDSSAAATFSSFFIQDFDAALPEFTFRRIDSGTGLPTDRVVPMPAEVVAAIDAGFLLINDPTFTKLIGVSINPRNSETPPVFVTNGNFGNLSGTTAGNLLVITDNTSIFQISPVFFQRGSYNLQIARPDGSAPITVLSDAREGHRFNMVVTEVAGIGFAAFVAWFDSVDFLAVDAEVILFDFAGNIMGRQSVDGPIGGRGIGTGMNLVALNDPSETQIKLLATWDNDEFGADDLAPRHQAEAFTFDIPRGSSGAALVANGTDYADFLRGLGLSDRLAGDRGDDFLVGNGGDDTLLGGVGADGLVGGTGDDVLSGGNGNDIMFGGAGDDSVSGDVGDDLLRGGAGGDVLDGGNGNDIIEGRDDADMILGGDGNDTLSGGAGNDILQGGTDRDMLFGGGGIDELIGEAGQDTLDGGAGNDSLRGNAGDDSLIGGSGEDFFKGGLGNDMMSGGDDNDTLDGEGGDDILIGGNGADQLFADTGADRLEGGDGDDSLVGGSRSDTLLGGAGNDVLFGDGGSDLLVGGAGADTFVFHVLTDLGSLRVFDTIRDFDPTKDALDFVFVGPIERAPSFSGAGEAEYVYNTTTGVLSADIDGDGAADFRLRFLNTPELPDLI